MEKNKNVTFFLRNGRLPSGDSINVRTPLDVVNALCEIKGCVDNEHLMKELSRREHEINSQVSIRTDSIFHFVHDLFTTSYLQIPGTLLENNILNYAWLFMEVAVPEALPNKSWDVLIRYQPVNKQTTGLEVEVRGVWEDEVVQVKALFAPEELADISTWPAKASHFGLKARNLT